MPASMREPDASRAVETVDQQNNKRTVRRKFVPVAVAHGGTVTTIDPAVHANVYAGLKI